MSSLVSDRGFWRFRVQLVFLCDLTRSYTGQLQISGFVFDPFTSKIRTGLLNRVVIVTGNNRVVVGSIPNVAYVDIIGCFTARRLPKRVSQSVERA